MTKEKVKLLVSIIYKSKRLGGLLAKKLTKSLGKFWTLFNRLLSACFYFIRNKVIRLFRNYDTLADLSQHEWEHITKTGDLSKICININEWYILYDLWIDKVGLSGKVKSKNKLLKEYALLLCDSTENPSLPQYEIKLKKAEIDSNKEVSDTGRDVIYPAIKRVYKDVYKKKITVEDYTNLYLDLRDGGE